MQQRPAIMSKNTMVGATERAKSRVAEWVRLAEDVINDTRRAERKTRHECKACFYSSRIGGAAMTTRPCMCCGADQLHGSTSTDVLCANCAKEHSLCKHCGGDLELRPRRKTWPVATFKGNNTNEI